VRTFAAAVLAVLVVVPLAASAQTRGLRPITAAWKGPQIAVTTRAGLNLVDPLSSRRALLTRKADPFGTADWAPNGQTLVFQGRDQHLYTIQRDGSGLRRLAKGVFPRWSPNGRQIAFFRSGLGLYVMNANGTFPHLIVLDRYTDVIGPPAWSPNSQTLAYIACTAAYLSPPCEHQYGFDVYTIPLTGPPAKKHRVSLKSGMPGCVQWSSRGRLSYTSGASFVVLVRNGHPKQLKLRGCAVWAPDGSRFATGNGNFGPIVARANGTGAHQLHVLKSKTFSITSVDWSPNSRSLSYLTEAGGGANARLFRVGLDGRHKRLLP
jgi:Tol biopolymer transport system component